ncbi:MAG TPA: hypothetical protein PLU72_02210 [Candidatus Ozemobacteraceae bacterium]|nr:hypothetical protein [Candidatus Ozemobacteraceae bacterium]HQG30234.1 hypothetical protein [Candidatus Ozemobacteraceae bacterium]
MNPHPLDVFLPFLTVPAGILAILLAINVILLAVAWLGGWSSLARAYPGRQQTGGETRSFRSLRFGYWTGYNNCVTIGGDSQGLHLSMPWFLRAGHEPIFIPWADMQIVEKQSFFGLSPIVGLAFKNCPGVRLHLQASLLADIQAGAGSLCSTAGNADGDR